MMPQRDRDARAQGRFQRVVNFARVTSQLPLKAISEIRRVGLTYETLPGLRERTRCRSCQMFESRLRSRIYGASQCRDPRPTHKKIRSAPTARNGIQTSNPRSGRMSAQNLRGDDRRILDLPNIGFGACRDRKTVVSPLAACLGLRHYWDCRSYLFFLGLQTGV